MHRPNRDEVLKISLSRALTPDEEAQLQQAFAADRSALDEEMRLSQMLRHLPDAPLSSNFTAQVLRRVEQEHRAGRRPIARIWRWDWFVSRWAQAAAAAVVLAGLFSYQQHQESRREELARSVARISSVAAVPSLEMLKDFEAINRLNQMPQEVDFELLAALQ